MQEGQGEAYGERRAHAVGPGAGVMRGVGAVMKVQSSGDASELWQTHFGFFVHADGDILLGLMG